MAKKGLKVELSDFQKSILKSTLGDLEPADKSEKKIHVAFADPFFVGSTDTTPTKADVQAHEKAVSNENPLIKSVLNVLNGPGDSIERLAFETNPSVRNSYQSLWKRKLRLLPDEILKRIAIQDDLVAAIVNTRSNQLSAFGRPQPDRFSTGYKIEAEPGHIEKLSSEQKEALQKRIAAAELRMLTCGSTEGWKDVESLSLSQFLFMSARNAVVFGRTATEIIWVETPAGRKFHSFRPIDAGTIFRAEPQKHAAQTVRDSALRMLKDLKNKNLKPERYVADEYSWVQVIDGMPRQAFTSEECLVQNFYPTTDVELDGYPVTPLDTVIAHVTMHINITSHNKLYFSSGRAARGMVVVRSDDIDDRMVAHIRQQFNASINSVANCVSGDMTITTDRGASSIAEFLGEKETKMARLWTGTDWCEALVYKSSEPKELVKTTLGNGVTLETSPDHRFRVIGPEGEPVWKRQKDLQEGDFVAVNKINASTGDFVPELNGKRLTPEMMELLGWMTGDGTLGPRSLRLYYHQTKERDVWSNHAKILEEFGAKVQNRERKISEEEKEYIKDKYGFKSVASSRIWNDVNDAVFVSKIKALGFTPSSRGPVGKTVPGFIDALPEALKAAFLRGFFSADGNNAKSRSPAITICNERLRSQTRRLLLSMGIRTSFSEGKTKLRISGNKRAKVTEKSCLRIKDRGVFFEKIGFIQAHKQPRAAIGTNKGWGTSSSIPRTTVLKYINQVKEKTRLPHGGRHDHGLVSVFSKKAHLDINAVVRGDDGCSLPRLINYMEQAGIVVPAWMTDYNYEPVVGTEKTGSVVPMYDVSVYDKGHSCSGLGCQDVKHSLMISGVYLSNSWRTPIFGVGSEDDVAWTPLDGGSRDMEYQYLSDTNARVILSAFQMSPEELPGYSHLSRGTNSQALSESNQEFKLEAHRDVGIRPLIANLQNFINAQILPLIDPGLAEHCHFKFLGLDADTAEKESVRLQQDMAVHMTMDEVLERVEKRPLGQAFGGQYPLNPQWQAVLDKFIPVGQQLEHFFGVEGASKDPRFAYVRDPFFFQWQQLQQQQQQMQMEQQAQQQGQGPQQAQQQQGQPGGEDGEDLTRSVDQLAGLLQKSEQQLPSSKRRLLAHQKQIVRNLLAGLEADAKKATEEILEAADKALPLKLKE